MRLSMIKGFFQNPNYANRYKFTFVICINTNKLDTSAVHQAGTSGTPVTFFFSKAQVYDENIHHLYVGK